MAKTKQQKVLDTELLARLVDSVFANCTRALQYTGQIFCEAEDEIQQAHTNLSAIKKLLAKVKVDS